MKTRRNVFTLLVLGSYTLLVGCSDSQTLFKRVPADRSGITFVNRLLENDSVNILQNEYVYNGGGVAAGDLDNDGLPELFFTGNQVSGALYHNEGSFVFTDITRDAGVATNRWTTGVTFADVDGDGWLDIYVSCAGYADSVMRRNYLFINQHNLTFREAASAFGIADAGYTTQSTFLDYDRDGDLDLYLLNHSNKDRDYNYIRPQARNGSGASTDKLFRNDDGVFTDVSTDAGITIEGYGLGIVVADVNNDSWPDIYVANDYVYNDILYINQHDGTFRDELQERVSHTSQFSMGVDASDINQDGYIDFIVADMLPPDNAREKTLTGPMGYDKFMMTLEQGYVPQFMRNSLQINRSGEYFIEAAQLAGIEATDWSWAPLLADFDGDGLDDLFITTGYYKNVTDRDFTLFTGGLMYDAITKRKFKENRLLKAVDSISGTRLPNRIFKNNGDLTFIDRTKEWGLEEVSFSHGAVYTDLDRDGDLDIVVNNLNSEASLYMNNSGVAQKSYLSFSLAGPGKNTFAIGATIEVVMRSGKTIRKDNNPVRGYQSSVEPRLHISVPPNDSVTNVRVLWPNGSVSQVGTFKLNFHNVVRYEELKTDTGIQSALLGAEPISATALGVKYKHVPSTYVDFKSEPLLPYRFSQHSPVLVAGDVNNDGLDDFYVGGSDRVRGELYIQQHNGKFISSALPKLLLSDETDGVFFDSDGDNDLDLYVTSGGNEYYPHAANYADKFYQNDGLGNFTWKPEAIPSLVSSKSCVVAFDFDEDGDQDLFLGGMVEPWRYPLPPDSYLLRNEGGRFVDVTKTLCPDLRRFALVKQATWADVDGNGKADLIIASEYQPLTIFIQSEDGRFTNATKKFGLNHLTGWWQSVLARDIDADGDVDLIAGNIGLNNKLKASPEKPVTLVAFDFDKNNSLDAITARFFDDGLHPIASRDMLFDQVPGFRKRFLYHRDYSVADLKTVVNVPLSKCYVLEATEMRSGVFINQGSTFQFQPLPTMAQILPIQNILVHGQTIFLSGGDITCDTNQGSLGAAGVIAIPSQFARKLTNTDVRTIRLNTKTRKIAPIKVLQRSLLAMSVVSDSVLLVYDGQ